MKQLTFISITLMLILLLCLALSGCTAESPGRDDSASGAHATGSGHGFGEWETVTAATCSTAGTEKRTCSCGAEETQEIPATGIHVFCEWETVSDASCGTPGTERRTCGCGAEETRETPTTKEHAFGEWSELYPATCTSTGIEIRTCVCGDTQSREICISNVHTYNEENTCTRCLHYSDAGVVFTLFRGTYSVTGYNGSSPIVVIPSTYRGIEVTVIGARAFSNCDTLTSVSIPASITTVESEAFSDCSALSEVYINDLAAWCSIEFEDIYANPLSTAGDLYLNNELVRELSVSDGITVIKDFSFYGCSVTGLQLPASVTSIGSSAFRGCTALETVSFAEGSMLTTVNEGAFYGCTSLMSVMIPQNTTSIGERAFWGCTKLIEIYDLSASLTITAGLESNGYVGYYANAIHTSRSIQSKLFTDANGYRFFADAAHRFLMGYTGTATELILPANCNGNRYVIWQYAFFENESIVSITVSSGVTGIGDHAFDSCSALTSITVPTSVTSIGVGAFHGCSALTSVTLAATDGWQVCSSSDFASNVTNLSASSLANTLTATSHLVSTYDDYYWRRVA